MGAISAQSNDKDTDIASAIEPRPALREPIAMAARNFDHPLLAARGIDVRLLRRKIATRNELFRKWRFKRPNVIATLRDGGAALFRNPRKHGSNLLIAAGLIERSAARSHCPVRH